MDLSRTRRELRTGAALGNMTYKAALSILDGVDRINEDAQESFEDNMRFHQQAPTQDDVQCFIDTSIEQFIALLVDECGVYDAVKRIVNAAGVLNGEQQKNYQRAMEAMTEIKQKLDDEEESRRRWAEGGDGLGDLGDLDEHPF